MRIVLATMRGSISYNLSTMERKSNESAPSPATKENRFLAGKTTAFPKVTCSEGFSSEARREKQRSRWTSSITHGGIYPTITSPSGGPHYSPHLLQHLTAILAPADREQAAKYAQTLGCIPPPTHPAPSSCKMLAQSSLLNRRPFSPFVMTYYPFRWFVFRPSSQLFSCLHWAVGKISGARRGYNACNATQTDQRQRIPHISPPYRVALACSFLPPKRSSHQGDTRVSPLAYNTPLLPKIMDGSQLFPPEAIAPVPQAIEVGADFHLHCHPLFSRP